MPLRTDCEKAPRLKYEAPLDVPSRACDLYLMVSEMKVCSNRDKMSADDVDV